MKKKNILISALALTIAFGTGVAAKETFETIKAQIRPDFVIEIDGTEREFKNANGDRVYPVLHDGTTYLPIRAIGEIMEKTVYWYEDEKRIELKNEKDEKTTVTDADVIIAEEPEKSQKDESSKSKAKDEKTDVDADFIGKEKAKEIALDKANLKADDVKFIRVELDKERGVAVYEVEFNYGLKEYNAEIKADDGTIIEWDVEFDD